MKKIIYILTVIIGFTFGACTPDEVTINDLVGPIESELIAATLNTPDATNFNIIQTTDTTVGNETNEAVSLTWEAASGDNDGDILYYVQVDVSGNDFGSAVTIPLAKSGTTELIRSLTFGELNEATNQISVNLNAVLSDLSINFGEENVLDVRVQTILGASIATGYSEALSINVTPYFTGLSDEISINGDALSQSVLLADTDGVFQNRVELTNSTFRFFAEPTDSNISYNYNYFESRGYIIDPLLVNADDTEMNFSFIGSEGAWDFSLNTIEKTITLTEILTPSELFLVGSLTGWDPATSLPFEKNGDIFTITVDLVDDDEFKFLPQNTSWDGDWGEDQNNLGSIIQEGEQNITGYTAGKYKVTVDFSTLTFSLEVVTSPDELFLVGSLTGWDPATSWPFAKTSENTFTLVAELPDGAEFKFLPQNTSWDGDWGEDRNNLGSIIQEDEQNVTGYAAGKYLITVNFNDLTYNLSSVNELYLVGSLTGWDPTTSIPMGEASLGTFSTIIDLPDGAEFKFLPQNTGWDGDWGEDLSNSGRIIQEGEQNLSGYAAGKYVIAVDFNTLSFTVSAVSDVPTTLYLVGAFNGWSNDSGNPQFTESSSGVFEITQTLSSGDEFKFVPVAGDWGNDWGESTVYSNVLEQGSEQNITVSDGGDYTIVVNFNNGTISVSL